MDWTLRRRLPGEDLREPLSPEPAMPEDQAWHLEVAMGRSHRRRVALMASPAQAEALLSAVEARGQALQRLHQGPPDAARQPHALPVFIDVTEEDLARFHRDLRRAPAPLVISAQGPALRRAAEGGYSVWALVEAKPLAPWTGDTDALRAALEAPGTLERLARAPTQQTLQALQALLTEPGPVGDRAADVLAELPLSLLDKAKLVQLAEGDGPTRAGRALRCLLTHRPARFYQNAWRLLRCEDEAPRRAGLTYLAVDNEFPARAQLSEGPEAHRALTAAWLRRVPAPRFPADDLRAWAGGRGDALAEEVLRAADAVVGPVGHDDLLAALVDSVFAEGQTELVLLDRNMEAIAAVIDPEILWKDMLWGPAPEDLARLRALLIEHVGEDDEAHLKEQLGWHGVDDLEDLLATLPSFAAELLGRVLRRGRAPELLQRVEAFEQDDAETELMQQVRQGMERWE